MSYCVACKYKQAVFLLADTAVSGAIGDKVEYNSFGQIQTISNGNYVDEALLKIVKIKDNFVIAYATDNVKNAIEMIETIKRNVDVLGIKEILKLLETSYGVYSSTELILVYSNSQSSPYIYIFSDGKSREVDWAEIGSGTNVPGLSNDVKEIFKKTLESDLSMALSQSIAELQCYIYHRNLFSEGIGGIFTGVYITHKVHYPRSLDCYIYDDDINQATSIISLLCFEEIFFSSSDSIVRAYTLPGSQIDSIIARKAMKAINTKSPFYFCIYSNANNRMMFMTFNGRVHNQIVSRYIRRSSKKTDYMFVFDPDAFEVLNFNSDKHMYDSIPFIQEYIESGNYNHFEFLNDLKHTDIDRWEQLSSYDYDFEYIEPRIDKTLIKKIKNKIGYYRFFVIIDYEYFFNSLKDLYELWSDTKSFTGEMEHMNFADFFSFMVTNHLAKDFVFDDCEIVFVKKPAKKHNYIGNFDFDEFLENFENVFVVADNKDFAIYCYAFLKNYYMNEDFFGLQKLIIVFDDKDTDYMLYFAAPKFNYDSFKTSITDTDIVLVREENMVTEVQTSFPHAVMQQCIFNMFSSDYSEWLSVEIELADKLCDSIQEKDVLLHREK